MNFIKCTECNTRAALLRCKDCSEDSKNGEFFCYKCSDEIHLQLKEKFDHRIEKLSYRELKDLSKASNSSRSFLTRNLKLDQFQEVTMKLKKDVKIFS